MGGKPGRETAKPQVLKSVPAGKKPILCKATFTDNPLWDTVVLTESETPNSSFLPWKSGACTETEIDLGNRKIRYFFTDNLSGCSLWYLIKDGTLTIRHEARTDESSQSIHSKAGFKLLFDSNKSESVTLKFDDKSKEVVIFAPFALLAHDESTITFHIQTVKNTKTFETGDESYILLNDKVDTISFKGLEGKMKD